MTEYALWVTVAWGCVGARLVVAVLVVTRVVTRVVPRWTPLVAEPLCWALVLLVLPTPDGAFPPWFVAAVSMILWVPVVLVAARNPMRLGGAVVLGATVAGALAVQMAVTQFTVATLADTVTADRVCLPPRTIVWLDGEAAYGTTPGPRCRQRRPGGGYVDLGSVSAVTP